MYTMRDRVWVKGVMESVRTKLSSGDYHSQINTVQFNKDGSVRTLNRSPSRISSIVLEEVEGLGEDVLMFYLTPKEPNIRKPGLIVREHGPLSMGCDENRIWILVEPEELKLRARVIDNVTLAWVNPRDLSSDVKEITRDHRFFSLLEKTLKEMRVRYYAEVDLLGRDQVRGRHRSEESEEEYYDSRDFDIESYL